MTEKEIIDELIALQIILKIGKDYVITEEYLDLLNLKANLRSVVTIKDTEKKPSKKKILESNPINSRWPPNVASQTGKKKVTALLDHCGVKSMDAEGKYLLRTSSKESVNIILKVMEDSSFDPEGIITVISSYYSKVEKPKSFNNFILDGVLEELYHQYLEGDLFKTVNTKKTNTKWL